MKTNTVINWQKKIALQIEIYTRAIVELNDLSENEFYTADAIELNCYEKFKHMLNKLINGDLNDASIEFITKYNKFDGKSLREIGEENSFEMLKDFEKILSDCRKDLIL